jgi:hypothetical protein
MYFDTHVGYFKRHITHYLAHHFFRFVGPGGLPLSTPGSPNSLMRRKNSVPEYAGFLLDPGLRCAQFLTRILLTSI